MLLDNMLDPHATSRVSVSAHVDLIDHRLLWRPCLGAHAFLPYHLQVVQGLLQQPHVLLLFADVRKRDAGSSTASHDIFRFLTLEAHPLLRKPSFVQALCLNSACSSDGSH